MFQILCDYHCFMCKSEQLIKKYNKQTIKNKDINAKKCRKRFITEYVCNVYQFSINQQTIILTKESGGIKDTARILYIPSLY